MARSATHFQCRQRERWGCVQECARVELDGPHVLEADALVNALHELRVADLIGLCTDTRIDMQIVCVDMHIDMCTDACTDTFVCVQTRVQMR